MTRNEQIGFVLSNMPRDLTRLDFMPDGGVDLYFGAGCMVITKPADIPSVLAIKVSAARKVLEKVAA